MLCQENMFRGTFVIAVLASLTTLSSVAGEVMQKGGICNSDIDCAGNLDCTRVSVFEKRCFPVSCARGAAAALLDYGFSPDGYIADVMNKTGLANEREFLSLGEDGNSRLTQALASTPPPMTVFKSNYSACLNPDSDTGSRKLDEFKGYEFFEDYTAYGVMWSVAALFSYFGKSTYWEQDFFTETLDLQMVSNCVGFLLGGDFGVDFLIQIYDDKVDNGFLTELGVGSKETETADPGETQFVPVFTAGPIGVQVGWWREGGPDEGTITEVSLGASLGAALMGFSNCYNEVTYDSPPAPAPAPDSTTTTTTTTIATATATTTTSSFIPMEASFTTTPPPPLDP